MTPKPAESVQDTELAAWYRRSAKELHEVEGEVEIDDGAIVSFGDDEGAYVQAWVWVHKPEDENCDCETRA